MSASSLILRHQLANKMPHNVRTVNGLLTESSLVAKLHVVCFYAPRASLFLIVLARAHVHCTTVGQAHTHTHYNGAYSNTLDHNVLDTACTTPG